MLMPMLQRMTMFTFLWGALSPIGAAAQGVCLNSQSTKLTCQMPTAFHTPASLLNFFNTAFGTQLSRLPLATPASGFLFTFDRSLGIYTPSSESFGPILAE